MDKLLNGLKKKMERGTTDHASDETTQVAAPPLGDCEYCGVPFSSTADDSAQSVSDPGLCVGCVVESSYPPERDALIRAAP